MKRKFPGIFRLILLICLFLIQQSIYSYDANSSLNTSKFSLNEPVSLSHPPGSVLTRCRNGLNILIPSLGSILPDSIIVGGLSGAIIWDLNIRLDTVFHTWVSDLVFNISHLGVSRDFVNHVGGSGDNFIGTILNDSAAISIDSGSAPFTGSYRPSVPLDVYNNMGPNGSWVLRITDNVSGDSGVLKAWCLVIEYAIFEGGIGTIEIPNYYSLEQNYPNPFNPSTTLKFSVPKQSYVTLKIYDVLGNETAVVVDEQKQPGFHTVNFDASNLGSGVYFCKLKAEKCNSVIKMVLIK